MGKQTTPIEDLDAARDRLILVLCARTPFFGNVANTLVRPKQSRIGKADLTLKARTLPLWKAEALEQQYSPLQQAVTARLTADDRVSG